MTARVAIPGHAPVAIDGQVPARMFVSDLLSLRYVDEELAKALKKAKPKPVGQEKALPRGRKAIPRIRL